MEMQEIEDTIKEEFASLMRHDEVLTSSATTQFHVQMYKAFLCAKEFGDANPTEKQTLSYQDYFLEKYSKVSGIYFPAMSKDAIASKISDKDMVARYGLPIAIVEATFLKRMSNKIMYFIDPVKDLIAQMVADEEITEDEITDHIRRMVRLTIGHERRHKNQVWMHLNGGVLLAAKGGNSNLHDAREHDANNWAWGFNNFWFGDAPILPRGISTLPQE